MTARELRSDASGSMVERVARALCAADDLNWEEQLDPQTSGSGDNNQVAYLHAARAAIEAMREPTPAMIDAAAVALEDTSFGEGRDYDIIRFVAEDIVRAALAPQPPVQQT